MNITKRFFCIVFSGVFAMPHFALAQDRYELTYAADIPLAFSGLGLTTVSMYLDKKIKPFTEEDIARLDPRDIPVFDRWVTKHWSRSSGKTSDYLLKASLISPIVLTLSSSQIRPQWKTVGVAYLETAFLSLGLTEITKTTVKRTRPALYNPDVPLSYKVGNRDARKSFFSGHVSTTAMSSFFAAKVYADFHPNSSAKTVAYASAATVTASVAALRMLAGKHFLSDVVVGALVGGAAGYFVPELHKKDGMASDDGAGFRMSFIIPLP